MRKFLPAIAVGLTVFTLCGCSFFVTEIETGTSNVSEYTYYSAPASTTAPSAQPSSEGASSQGSTAAPVTEPSYGVTVTQPSSQETTAIRPTETTPLEPMQTAAPETGPSASAEGDVDLGIQLPDANGTMEVSLDPANSFIKAVHDARGIDAALLAAVYAVPESGQNYVLEFNSAGKRTADNLRRVYLLKADGSIASVAAAKNSERENLSATENWFCMNVLIKSMVMNAVADKLK